jgi:hypothetical protein
MYYKYKHLTIKDREDIETMLKEGLSFRKIALNLNADPTLLTFRVLIEYKKKVYKPLELCDS